MSSVVLDIRWVIVVRNGVSLLVGYRLKLVFLIYSHRFLVNLIFL